MAGQGARSFLFLMIMRLQEAYKLIKKELEAAGIEEFENDSGLIISEVTKKSVLSIKLTPFEELSKAEEERLFEITERRRNREPLQFILGYAYFMGLKFPVSREDDTLIPRFDTEVLCEVVQNEIKGDERVLDLCTGSGCILLSIAKNKGISFGAGCDISEKAILAAKRNADLFSLSDSCHFFCGDLYEALPEGTEPFDIIVSNPPYIRERDMENLMPEVRLFEPERALYGGEDGLCFYRRIIKDAGAFLKPQGKLFLEIGMDEGKEVSDLLREAQFSEIRIIKDLNSLDRVVMSKKRT